MTAATEVWFRNPDNYIRELIECGVNRAVFDRGFTRKKSIDVIKFADLHWGAGVDWRVLHLGEQGTAEYRPGCTLDTPVAVYPTWRFGDDMSLLEEIINRPVGEDEDVCNDKHAAPDELPVLGQEHRVIITDLPPGNSGPGRRFFSQLKEIQEDAPECIIHVHGLYSYRIAFGMGYAAADMEPRTLAQKGKVTIANGKEVKYEQCGANPQWTRVVGMHPADLDVPRNRCMFNIRTSLWAAQNFNTMYNFKTSGATVLDIKSSDDDHKPEETKSPLPTGVVVQPGDKQLCNTCSLQDKCKVYREGSVCTLPNVEPAKLATFFNTRNADTIIDGLGILLGAQASRAERGMRDEENLGDINPQVSKEINSLFKNAVQLAKLANPHLNGPGTAVQVNVMGGGQAAVANSNPQELMASAVTALTKQGIRREDITPDMIKALLTDASSAPQLAIGSVVRDN